MNVMELEGAALDLWVAEAAGVDAVLSDPHRDGSRSAVTFYSRDHDGHLDGRSYCPSSHWSDGGPIIERESIATWKNGTEWRAQHQDHPDTGYYNVEDGSLDVSFHDGIAGPTPLIAAMRAFVASKFGDEVPDIKEMNA